MIRIANKQQRRNKAINEKIEKPKEGSSVQSQATYHVAKMNSSSQMVNFQSNKIVLHSINRDLLHNIEVKEWDHSREHINFQGLENPRCLESSKRELTNMFHNSNVMDD